MGLDQYQPTYQPGFSFLARLWMPISANTGSTTYLLRPW